MGIYFDWKCLLDWEIRLLWCGYTFHLGVCLVLGVNLESEIYFFHVVYFCIRIYVDHELADTQCWITLQRIQNATGSTLGVIGSEGCNHTYIFA